MPLKIQPNMKFGDWTVIERDYNPSSKQHSTFWFCKCGLCDNIYSVSRDTLVRAGGTCCNKCKGTKISKTLDEKGYTLYKPKIGDKFGYLTISSNRFYKNKSSRIKCKCVCGKEIEVNIKDLFKGHGGNTISCGCATMSSGEIKISLLLKKMNVNFINQYRIKDFNARASFDFAIFNENNNLLGLIEYDGEQHFHPVDYFGGEEKFKLQQERDQKKNNYCKENNIKLIRISYQDFDKITENYIYSFFPELK